MKAYPEERPQGIQPVKRFKIDLDHALTAEGDINLQIEALEMRIQRFIDKCQVRGAPIINHILNLTHDEEELARLGAGLQRVAGLVKTLDTLQDKKRVLEVAKQEPEWMAWAIGDFSDDVDNFLGSREE